MKERRLYFNNCLTAKPAPEVVEAMLPYLRENYYYPENFNRTGTESSKNLTRWKQTVAATIGAAAEEIHFTSGGTIANNIAIKGFLLANAAKGNHLICSVVDYPDLLANAGFFEQSGFEVTYLQVDEEGFIDLEQLKKSLRKETILFMTTSANHTVGTIQPLAEIRKILDSAGHHIYIHADACEAYGRIPIAVNNPHIDMMSVSGHKIYGPQGSGFLYLRKGVKINPLIHGIVRLDDLQTGGLSVANTAGLVKAIELIFADFEEYIGHLRELNSYFLEKVREKIPYIMVNGPVGDQRAPHNMNITFDYIEGEAIMLMLDQYEVSVATGSACASQGLKPNYVLKAMGRSHEQAHGSMKFTFSRYLNKQDIDELVDRLVPVVEKLREGSTLYPGN
jgi:cysteine desulfurase